MDKFFVRPLGIKVDDYSFIFKPKDETVMVAKCLLNSDEVAKMTVKVYNGVPDYWHIIEGLVARVNMFTLHTPPDLIKVQTVWNKYYDEVVSPAYQKSLDEKDNADKLEDIIKDFPQRLAQLTPHNRELLRNTVGAIRTVEEAFNCNKLLNDLLRVQKMDAILKK